MGMGGRRLAVALVGLAAGCANEAPTLGSIETEGATETSGVGTTSVTPDPTADAGSTGGNADATGTTGGSDATSTTSGDSGESTGDSGSSTGPVSTACAELVNFEMQPADATLSGDWVLGTSMVGEGEIIMTTANGGHTGSILFEPDIPCDDTWHIWVRYWQSAGQDSYLATLDGMPQPEAVFEGDCTADGDGYAWGELNWRDQNAATCEYVVDPWTADWAAGVHAIEFSYRESLAMGRILLTNDPSFVPE
jgi:hypothetical protein